MADPSTILAILHFVGTAAMAVCQAVDKAIELEHEEKQALKELRKGVESLKSDTLVYKVLLNAMESDTDLDKRSPYARFIQRYVIQAHMLTELMIYNITDRTERKRWKALKERSRLRNYCLRTQQEIARK